MARVMVVDDEPRIRTYLNRSLSAQGHSVFEAADGQAALDELELRDVDLILLDLAMPRCGGLGVLSVLSQREASPPVIVLSAATDISARVRRHLQRQAPASSGEQRFLVVGGVQLDLDRRRAITAHGSVSLTDIWGLDFDPGSNVVDVCVRRLRTKLQPDPPIETVRGAGYCFYDR